MRELTLRLLRSVSLIALLAAGATAALADGGAGPYLAGRVASIHADYKAAAAYFTQALVSDPTNAELQENALLAQLAIGAFDKGQPMAEALDRGGVKSPIADMAILATKVRAGDFQGVIAALDAGKSSGPLVDGFLRAWSVLGNGQMSDALAAFDGLVKQPQIKSLALYNKALALASVGDFEGADKILSGAEAGPINATRRSVVAHAQVLSQLERDKDALELIDKIFGADTTDPVIAPLRADLAAGKSVPFDLIRSPIDGLAEVYFAVASALGNDLRPGDISSEIDVLLFARTALHLRPDLSEAALVAADMLERQEQHELAIEVYQGIDPASPDHLAAELGRSDALLAEGKTDAAIEVLQQLSRAAPDRIAIWASLGDVLRRNERFSEGAEAYDRALALVEGDARDFWGLYYARGICQERLDKWDAAEADFRKALDLSPDQPSVLNYLGYSLLEKKVKLDEALAMIERAAKARPDDGAISDSLGWAFYRLGRYADAEAEMERAIHLMPVDPVVNDHLGDVYWAVGRKREAEFQWKRALSFKPDTEDEAKRIRRKLEVGLDLVLKEEGSDPLAVTKNGN
jgi:tetratricopeptide (TPR) repeat protein